MPAPRRSFFAGPTNDVKVLKAKKIAIAPLWLFCHIGENVLSQSIVMEMVQ